MKKTSNYQLNQWEEEDRILRTDFNGDNAKIDAAIQAVDTRLTSEAARLSAPVCLRSGVSGGTVNQITLSTAGIQWNKYSLIVFDLSMPTVTYGTFTSGAGGAYRATHASGWTNTGLMPLMDTPSMTALLFVGGNGDTMTRIIGSSNDFYVGRNNAAVKNVSSFQVITNNSSVYFPAGTVFSMWGVS